MFRGVLSVLTVVLFVAVAAPQASARPLTQRAAASTTRDTALITAVNSVRTVHLLPKLRLDADLSRAALSHSRDMLLHDYFAHGDFSARMSRFGVRGRDLLVYCGVGIRGYLEHRNPSELHDRQRR